MKSDLNKRQPVLARVDIIEVARALGMNVSGSTVASGMRSGMPWSAATSGAR
jgi:hypothetical protein